MNPLGKTLPAGRLSCRSCQTRCRPGTFLAFLQGFVVMHPGSSKIAYSFMIATVFVVIPLCSGDAATVTAKGTNVSPCSVSSPHRGSGCKPTVPVANKTVLSAPSPHSPTRHRSKPAEYQSKSAQQYYQPARQYYQWQGH